MATGAHPEAIHVEEEASLRPGLLQWVMQQHSQQDSAHAAVGWQNTHAGSDADHEAPVATSQPVGAGRDRWGLQPALPGEAAQSMNDSDDESAPAGLWGLPHATINCNNLEGEACQVVETARPTCFSNLAHAAAEGDAEAAGAPNVDGVTECTVCCADTDATAVPVMLCGFGSCAGVGVEVNKVMELSLIHI